MPELVEPEDARIKVRPFGDVNDRAEREEDAAQEQPDQRAHGHRGEHHPDPHQTQPAHRQIDHGGQPTRRSDREHLDRDTNDGHRPDNGQYPPAPETGEEVDADGRVGAGDQEVDRRVIELAEHQGGLRFRGDQVIGGARGEHQDQGRAVDQERRLLGEAVPADDQERHQTETGRDGGAQVHQTVDRLTKFDEHTPSGVTAGPGSAGRSRPAAARTPPGTRPVSARARRGR